MSNPGIILTSYLPIVIGILFIIFHKELTLLYEKFAEFGKGSAFPRIISVPRLIIGGMMLIGMGLWRLFER